MANKDVFRPTSTSRSSSVEPYRVRILSPQDAEVLTLTGTEKTLVEVAAGAVAAALNKAAGL